MSAKVIQGFRLEKILQQGGMGVLWEVTHPDYSDAMVMKIPLMRYGDGPAGIVGFEVEQMVLPKLTGPHVPRVLAVGDFSDQPFIVMEKLPGEALVHRLPEGALPLDQVVSIGIRVARALHEIHRQNVVHLDVKPSNIMFRENGDAVLIDFGYARHDQLPDLLAEEFHFPMGTRTYISPEQLSGIRGDPRSDLFALGILLYHLLTGQRPFGDPKTQSGMRRRIYKDPIPPVQIVNCPPWLQEVILHCLEVDPRARPQTAAQVALMLQYPDQIALGDRSKKLKQDGFYAVMKRWVKSFGDQEQEETRFSEQLSQASIVMVAIDLSPGGEQLRKALKEVAKTLMEARPSARLACVTVLKIRRVGISVNVDAQGRNRHVKRLVALKSWARELNFPEDQVTYHVLEAPDQASAILEYASNNHVDQVLIGARGNSKLRRYLGSVSSRVVAEAPCTVTVVRVPGGTTRGRFFE